MPSADYHNKDDIMNIIMNINENTKTGEMTEADPQCQGVEGQCYVGGRGVTVKWGFMSFWGYDVMIVSGIWPWLQLAVLIWGRHHSACAPHTRHP